MNTQSEICKVCDEVRDLLLEKNFKYGDSALNPQRVFSRASSVEQLNVRIDDKLSRIKQSGTISVDEDTLQDLIGYLVLLKIATSRREGLVPFATTYEDFLEDQILSAMQGDALAEELNLDDDLIDDDDIETPWDDHPPISASKPLKLDFGTSGNTFLADQTPSEGASGFNDYQYLWDPALGPIEPPLEDSEIYRIISRKDLSIFDKDEIVSTVFKKGLAIGIKKDGSTCILNAKGGCQ